MQPLAITPAEVDFDLLQPRQELAVPVCIKNLDTRPRSFRIKTPATRWFSLRGIGSQHRLAPGLAVTFEVVFNGGRLDSITPQSEFHDTIRIACESVSAQLQELPMELWVHARPPRALLRVEGDLQFGVLAVGATARRQLQLQNSGSAAADFSITWDKSLPVSVEPASGRLGAAGSADSTSTITVTLSPLEPAAVVGELAVSTAGMKEPLLQPLGASVVQSSYQIIDSVTKAPVTEIAFGELFFGESVSRELTLVNSGPTEVCFDLSFGSTADLKALLATGPDEDVTAADDRLATFLQVARIRAKSREDKGTMLRVSPISGVIAPYSSSQLSVTFKPFALDGPKPFKAQPLAPPQQVQPFDGLLQVNIASKHLRVPVKGCGLACMLKVQPEVMHFGLVPTYQWADQLLQLSNDCSQLPMQLSVVASGPYFSSLPAQLELAPGAAGEVVLRYRPKALGHHQAAMCVQVMSLRSPGRVLFEAPVQVQGSSTSVGPKQALPGGITATSDTFTLPRAIVSEADAAIAHLVAEKTYRRPQLWEVAENADRLEGIGAKDKFGVTMAVHQARVAHAQEYTTFIQARRTAAARKYLTQPEGGKDDVNMGMQPFSGLHPTPLRLKQQVDPLWTISQHAECAPTAQKLPPAAVLAGIPTFKEWPETAQERTACSAALTSEQLSSLTVAPRQLDFGKLSPAAPGQQTFLVTNPLAGPLHVVLNLGSIEGLSCVGPCSQVVPPGATAKFLLQLHSHDTQHLKDSIQYVVNGCHFQSLLVCADVVPVTLDVSEEEVMFAFGLDNWDSHVEQALMLDNPHSFPVEYEWSVSSPVFTVAPLSGTVKARSSCQVSVKWTPGSAACGATKAVQQPAAAAAAAQEAGSGPSKPKAASTASAASPARKLSKSGSSAGAAAALANAGGAKSDAAGSATGRTLAANNSSITVELPAEATAAPAPGAAAAAGVGCQHTGYMTLKLKGGGDVAPKKVVLFGELSASLLKFAVKEVNLGPLPLFEQQSALVQIKNAGSVDAAYRVLPNSLLSVSPEHGQVAAEGSSDLEVMLLLTQPGPISAVLELDLRGGKVLRLPIRAEGVVPQVHVAEPLLHFPSTFIGTTHTRPLTLVNTTPVPATLMCDLMQQPEFELHLSREAWAGAGYAACPVKRIGANGEMSTVGSTRQSRRTTTHGMRVPGGTANGGSGGSGFRFLITLQPSSTLPLQMVYRPSIAQPQQFALPLALQHSYGGGSGSTAAANVQAAAAGVGGAAAAQRRSSTERRASVAGGGSAGGHSKPGSAAGSTKAAAAADDGDTRPQLSVPVEAEGVVPKVILSKSALDFGSRVARRALQGGKSPHVFDVVMRNNTDSPLQVAVGGPAAASAFQKPSSSQASGRTSSSDAAAKPQNAGSKGDASSAPAQANSSSSSASAYAVEGWADTKQSAAFVSLEADEELQFSVRFSPSEARVYEAVVPVYLDGCRAAPYMLVQLSGTGTLPRLTFDVAECVLPMVPLGITSTARVWVVNDGYDNAELSVRLPPDTSRLPVSVAFPEGKLIGLAKERLPMVVTCCSSRPLSFTTTVDLLDEDGRAFSLVVTGATDNCSLSHCAFSQLNMDRLQLLPPPSAAGGGCWPLPLRLSESGGYEMPLDEAVGPLHLSKSVIRYLAAVTSSNWTKKARGSSKAGAPPAGDSSNNNGSGGSGDADAAGVLRQWLLSSRGKGLLELIEALGGKPVSLKGAAAGKSVGGGSGKLDPVQQLLAIYEAALNHLRAQGALLNTVKPEYLLPEGDFSKLMEDRSAAAAGNPDEEDALEYWAAVEASFGAYSAMAWNCVLLQLLKVYALARVTPAALRQLLSSMGIQTALPPTSAAAPGPPPVAAKAAVSKQSATGARNSAGAKAAAQSASPAAAEADTDVIAVEPGSVPPDDVLSGSNVFSTPEACLLAWMNAHTAKAFPKLELQVTNFGRDLRDGLVVGALIAAYWPGDSSAQLLSRLHTRPATPRHLKENQELVVKALQELCLPYELSASDLDEAEPQVLLATYLFTALPQFLPRATLDFTCKLGDQQVREIQLSNPTRRPLSYAARLEGAPDFSLEASLVKIDPGQSMQVPVSFKPATSLPKACRLVLMSRRDNPAASAATLVFSLKGQADTQSPLKQVNVTAPLYQLATQECSITNPFAFDCDFSISIVPIQDPKPSSSSKDAEQQQQGGKKDAKAPVGGGSAAAAKGASAGAGAQQVRDVRKLLPEPFGIDRHRLRLKAGASEKLKLSFLPFVMPAAAAPPPSSPAKGQQGRQTGSKSKGQQEPPAAPLVRARLVLKDSECGEFAYELCGEIGQPAAFLQHEAKVGLDGTQVVEVQLPFSNHLLENARRSYAEKHPLGRDKEQTSRLRADIGSINEQGQRVLEYVVTSDSPFFTVPPAIVLKSSPPAQSAAQQDAGGSSSPDVGSSRGGSSQSARGQTAAGASSGKAAGTGAAASTSNANAQQAAAASNVIKLGLKPVGPGVYPAHLVLQSAFDVRHIDVQVTAQARGQSCALDLECPARQQVLQELPLLNAGSDVPLAATATLTGKGFSGPRDVTVPAKSDGSYPLTFHPPGSGNFTGTLELLLAPTGERLVYTLTGKASEPLAEGHVLVECQARSETLRRLQVPNIMGSLPLQYSIYADADFLTGPATLNCASANRGDTYKLSVCPLTSGTHWGSISCVAPDGNYCWYSVEVRATEPPDQGTITASCPVHQALSIKVSLTNPTDKPLQLRPVYGCRSLLGPSTFVAPAGPGSEATFECFYTPLVQGAGEGVLRLVSREAGEFWWKLALEATAPLPQPPIELSAPLGSTAHHTLSITNPTAAEAVFTSSSSSPDKFWVVPQSFKVAPNSVADVQLSYQPGSYRTLEHATVTVSSQAAGSYEFNCTGQGEAPSGVQSSSITSVLGAPSTSDALAFTNPFDRPVEIEVTLSSVEAPGTFALALPGVVAAADASLSSEQQDSKAQWAGLDAGDGAGVSSRSSDSGGGGGGFGGLLGDAVSALNALAGAALAENAQKQPKQPIVQQVLRVTVQPRETLQLPVSFAPQVLRQAAAQLSVTVLPDASQAAAAFSATEPEEAVTGRRLIAWGASGPAGAAGRGGVGGGGGAGGAAAAADNPLCWHYDITGIARADVPGLRFSCQCVAKQAAEQVLEVPLPGLDVEQAAAAAAAAAAATASGPTSTTTASAAAAGLSGGAGGFRFKLLLPEEHRAALTASLALQQLDTVLMPAATAAAAGASGSISTSSSNSNSTSPAAAGCGVPAPVLRYLLRFAPLKALSTTAQLVVECGEGGACWMYDLILTATAPDIAGVLTLEAHLGCTAELPLFLTASGSGPQPFTAEFTPESPLVFDVVPSRGLLPPQQPDASTSDALEVSSSVAAAATGGGGDAATAAAVAQAPLKVTFTCKEMGKVVSGKLVVVTPDRQETFIVKGRQPAYVAPSAADLPSGTYLTGTTASSRAKGGCSASRGGSGKGVTTTTTAAGGDVQSSSGGGTQQQQQQQQQRRINYLQRNIKAATTGGGAGGSSPKRVPSSKAMK